MHPVREIPPVSSSENLLDGGHLWLYEFVVADPFRFRLQSSGRLRVGDETTTYDPDDVPPRFRHVVRHIRESCNWSALRSAVDDVSSITFSGFAMQHAGLDYDWGRTPSFLGTDVWMVDRASALGVDRTEQVFERLGLHPLNTVAKEYRAVDFDPSSYSFLESAWYDGPVAGVVIRNKRGSCGLCRNTAVDIENRPEFDQSTAEALAADIVTAARVERVVADLRRQNASTSFAAVYERVLDAVFREVHPKRFGGVDHRAFRSAVADLTQQHR